MFTPKILRLLATGVVSVALLGAGIISLNQLNIPVDDLPDWEQQLQQPVVVAESTEIVAESKCPVCGKSQALAAADILRNRWLGMDRNQLEKDLSTNYPLWSVAEFNSSRIVLERIPQRCDNCKSQWPQEGFIGLHEGRIAVYTAEHVLVEVLETAPGVWYDQLQEGMPFFSAEECERLLINLTS